MKRFLFLLCALLLVLSLCSCRGRETEQTTGQPAGKKTAEEAVESGVLLSTVDLMDEVEADLEQAQKSYTGHYYLMNLVVDSISNPEYVRAGFNIRGRGDSFIMNMFVTMDLPEEEREGLALRDVLQVVGKISNIERINNGLTFVELTDTHIVTKTFQISGEIKMVLRYDTELGYYFIVSDDSGNVFPDSVIYVFLPEEGNYAEGDRITATGTLSGGMRWGKSGVGTAIYSESAWPFNMDDPESIEIIDS